MASTPAGKRPTPFTPPSSKKYKAALSTESRTRNVSSLPSVPGSPTKSRPSSRAGSRMGTASPALTPMFPQHNVEESVVDFQSVGVDLTGDEHGGDVAVPMTEVAVDKVMVSCVQQLNTHPQAGRYYPARTPSTSQGPQPPPPRTNSHSTPSTRSNPPPRCTRARRGPTYTPSWRATTPSSSPMDKTASGKTYTLSGNDEQPGIIPRAIREIFAYIRATPSREYLLRCSYLEIYNETIHDLLAPGAKTIEIQGGAAGSEVVLSGLREEVVTSLASVREVLRRGEGNRRTASTDWNERSSRSHSSRERGDRSAGEEDRSTTPTMNGRHTPGFGGRQTPGPRLRGSSVQSSVLKATSDKERTKEGRYINTSLLTLGTVIATLAENAAKGKSDHVPFRNSKLTRMLQPSLSGNARISVVCTINPDASAVAESMSTLQFARRIKGVHLNAQKKEIVDTDALIERYRKEIEDLKTRLAEREKEADAPSVRTRRLSAREQIDESKAMTDLNTRIKQLTKLILTSQSVGSGDDSRPGSPVKIDFDMSPYQLQQELLAARLQLESQSNQILSLEATLSARPEAPNAAVEDEKDKVISDQARRIRELETVVSENLAQPPREDVEKEWQSKVDAERRVIAEKEAWANELVRQLEKEKKMRLQLEEERRALAAFVSKFDSLGLGLLSAASSPVKAMPSPGGASAVFAGRREARQQQQAAGEASPDSSPIRMSLDLSMSSKLAGHPSLLEQTPEEDWTELGDVSFETEVESKWSSRVGKGLRVASGKFPREIFGVSAKENVP
ncbi:P-loop containing nucleoside triphosphate hydrolase protein [Mycena olivaceomarginata]|nr:P-loop containing nucleoside triphosphate hydrolase protein [Mycena olivaceomarginata]